MVGIPATPEFESLGPGGRRARLDTARLMGIVLGLGLAAALYPQLLAVVVVILTRPSPRPLLWACYVGAVSVSVGCGIAVLLAFRSRETVLGSTSRSVGAATYLTLGALVLMFAVFAASGRGRALLGGNRRAREREPDRQEARGHVARVKLRAGEALQRGSLPVALGVGGLLGLPGPFDLLALGHIARARYSTIAVVGLIAVFTLAKFLLIELPIVSYLLDPDRTAARVARFSTWMSANKITVVSAVVAVVGLVLVGRGISGLG